MKRFLLLCLIASTHGSTGPRTQSIGPLPPMPTSEGYWTGRKPISVPSFPIAPPTNAPVASPSRVSNDTNMIVLRIFVDDVVLNRTVFTTNYLGAVSSNRWFVVEKRTNTVVGYRSGTNVIEAGTLNPRTTLP